MSVLGGTLREFLEFMSARAAAFPPASADSLETELRHELDLFVGLGLAAYEELGELSQEASQPHSEKSPTQLVINGIREGYASYLAACQPVLKLIQRAGQMGVEPKKLAQFMATVGEADLIANRYEKIMKAEREVDLGQTRTLEEVRDGLRNRIRPSGG